MKTQIRTLFLSAALACFFTLMPAAFAQEKPAPQPAEKSAPPAAEPPEASEPTSDDKAAAQPAAPAEPEEKAEPALRRLDEPSATVSEEKSSGDEKISTGDTDSDAEQPKPVAPKKKAKKLRPAHASHGNGAEKVAVFHNAHLQKGEKADVVVSVLGSSTSEGEVSDAVVSVLGNNRVTGPVGDSVVSVLGNSYINSKVNGQVVTVLGNLELGPEAEVGDIVIVGQLKRDPKAIVHGQIDGTEMDSDFAELTWLHTWVERCLLYARPLAVGPHLGWAWMIALGFLFFYVFLALLFRGGIERCAQTLETRPGYSVLATVLTVLLAPLVGILLIVLLAITGVGLVLIPFILAAVFFATLFGKAVMLAWLGRRITKFFGDGPLNHAAVAVLVGGVIVLALYTVPVMGLIVYKLLDMLGLGVVIYTLILSMQREKPKAPVMAAAAAAPTAASTPTPAPAPAAAMPMRSAGFGEAVEPAPVTEAAATPVAAEAGAGAVPVTPVPPVASVPPVMAYTVATLPRAGFWIRFAASFLDWVIIGAACGILHAGGGVPFVFAAYCVVLWATRGTTVGGIVCGLKVVRLDDRPVDWSVALVRALGGFLSLAVAGLGFIWVAFDHDKQSWHDKIAGTTIVRLPKGASII
ncbi:MAG: RDD family protein [Verrucomicrobia bacterium]|nr:RDD family protein [Verrucomicrobiota bacterium]